MTNKSHTSGTSSSPVHLLHHPAPGSVNRPSAKARRPWVLRGSIAALLATSALAPQSAKAATYYWDDNDITAGFGSATGTWSATTTGTTTYGWTTDTTGATTVNGNSITTQTTDALNFGSGATGLGAGTITVGTVSAGDINFASGDGTVVLSGGTITLAAAETITVNNATDTISSVLAGAATSVTKAGTGALILSGANTYTGATTISAGTLSVSSLNNVSGGSASSSLGAPTSVANGTIGIGAGGTSAALRYTGTGETTDRVLNLAGTTGGAFIDQSGTGLLKFSSALTATGVGAKTVTLQGFTEGTGEIGGAIVNSSSGATALTKLGSGTWTLSGTSTYTGATTVSAGILRVTGSLASGSAVTVSNGALGGNGTVSGAVTVSAATGAGSRSIGGITLVDGSVGTLTLGSTLSITGAAGLNFLNFDLGSGSAGADKIAVAASPSITNAGVLVGFNQIGGTANRINAGTYTIIASTTSAPTLSKYALATTAAFGNTYVLSVSGNNLQVTTAQASAGPASPSWAGSSAPWATTTNWSGSTIPGYQSNVTFNTASGTLSTTLGQDFDINSLTFGTGSTSAITIAKGSPTAPQVGMLTIEATNANGNTAGNGITVNTPTSGTPTQTISCPVGIASSQTWTVNTGAALTVSGVITDFGGIYGITKAGAGTLTLSAFNTFTGPIAVNAGTLALTPPTGSATIMPNTFTGSGTINANPASGDNLALNGNLSGFNGAVNVTGNTSVAKLVTNLPFGAGTIVNIGTGTTTGTGATWYFGAPSTAIPGNTQIGITVNINSTGNSEGYGALRVDGGATIDSTSSVVLKVNGATIGGNSTLGTGTINAPISDGGNGFSLTKIQQNTIRLGGTNTYTGGTTIGAGTLQIIGSGSLGTGNYAGAIANATTLQYSSSAAQIFSGVISGAGLLIKDTSSTSTLTLSGANNTYTGVTDISAGILNVGTFSDYGVNGSLGARLASAETATGDGIGIHIGSGTTGATLQYTGSTAQSTNRQIRLSAANNTIDASGTGAGTLSFTYSGANTNLFDTAGTRTLTLAGSDTGNNTFAIRLADQTAVTGTTSLTKSGAGTWIVSGASTYTGATSINGGTLQAGSATALGNTSGLSISGGATLDLRGNNITLAALSTGTGTITDSSAAGSGLLTVISAMTSTNASTLITGNLGVHLQNAAADDANVLTNTANTYSGGTYCGNGSSGFRFDPTASQTIGNGVGTALSSGVFGTGTIYIGTTTTDYAQLYFGNGGATINNAITYNTQAGDSATDAAGAIRVGSTSNTLAGIQTAGATAITIGSLSTSGSVTITGRITGSGTFSGTTQGNTSGGATSGFTIGTNAGLIVGSASSGGSVATLILNNASANNNYTGDTYVTTAGILQTNAANQLPSGNGTGDVYLDGKFNLQGNSQAIGGLSGTGTLDGVSGTPTLTIGGNNATGLNFSGVIQNTGGTLSLTKTGTGTLTLSGANIYTGATTVNSGTLVLDYSTVNLPRIPGTARLVLGGGTLNLNGGTTTEVVPSTTLTAGTASSVTVSLGISTLQMGTITPGTGATVNFGSANIATTNNPNDASGILGTWATIGGTDWAINSTGGTNGPITAYTGYTTVQRLTPGTIANGPTNNVQIIEGSGSPGNILLGGGSTTTVNTLNQSSAFGNSAATIDPAGNTFRTNAILVGTNAGALTIGTGTNNGTLSAGTAGGNLTLINNSVNVLTINSVIANNTSASSLSMNGAGTVTLTGANTYTGGTTLNVGALQLGSTTAIGTGTLTITGGSLDSSVANLVNANNNAQTWNGNFTFVGTQSLNLGTGAVTLGTNSQVTVMASSLEVDGAIGGAYSLAMAGAGTLTLGGASTYTGATTVSAGTLNLTGSLTGSNITVSGAAVFTEASSGVIAGTGVTYSQSSAGISTLAGTNTYTGATAISAGTLQIGGAGSLGSGTYAGNIANAGTLQYSSSAAQTLSGIISGAGVLIKDTSSTSTLTLTGANTYTGATTISAGTLQIGGAGSLGSGTYAGNISSAGTLEYSSSATQILSGIISGAGALTKDTSSAGTLILTGANTYTGMTAIGAGTLQIGSSSTTSATIGTGAITNNGTLYLNNSASSSATNTLASTNTLTGTGVLSGNSGAGTIGILAAVSQASVSLTSAFGISNQTLYGKPYASAINLWASSISTSANQSYNGIVSIAGAPLNGTANPTVTLTTTAGGSVILPTGVVSGFSGYQSAGTLNIDTSAGNGAVSLAGQTLAYGVGNLNVNSGTATTTLTGGSYFYDYSVFSSNVALTGATSFAPGNNKWVDGLQFNGSVTGAFTLTVSLGNGTALTSGTGTVGFAFKPSAPATASSVISGTSGLNMSGSSTLTLSGANTYSGGTTVSAGNVVAGVSNATTVSGAFGPSGNSVTLGNANTTANNSSPSVLIGGAFTVSNPITVANQATSGTYTIGGSTANSSTFSGAITLNQPLTVSQVAGGTVNLTGGVTGASTTTLTVSGAGGVTIASSVALGTGELLNANSSTGTLNINSGTQTYATLQIAAGSGTTNVNTALGAGTTVNANATTNFTTSQTINALNIGGTSPLAGLGEEPAVTTGVSLVVTPEPGSISLLLVGALGLASRRRRRA